MGNSTPKPVEGMQQHDRLGHIKTKENMSQMQLSRPVQNKKKVQQWTNEMSEVSDSQSREILMLPDKHRFQEAGFCGSSGTVYATYQNFPYVLTNEISNRRNIDRNFLQTQIWYLLYNMIRAGNKLQRLKRKVGNLHPDNILINDDGQIKIISTCSIPGQLTNFQKILQTPQSNVYLAPEELQAVNNRQYAKNIDPCRAEVFSIGLTILSSGTLENCDQIYIKQASSIRMNTKLLNDNIRTFANRFSPYLTNLLSNMLSQNPSQRKRSSQIYQILSPHENQILDLQPFAVEQSSHQQQQQQQQQQSVYSHPISNNTPVVYHHSYSQQPQHQQPIYRHISQQQPQQQPQQQYYNYPNHTSSQYR